jgi:hypothetical protein
MFFNKKKYSYRDFERQELACLVAEKIEGKIIQYFSITKK